MVVTEDGLPKKSEYRRFKIKEVDGNNDFAAMEEVLRRRLTAYLIEREKPASERPGKFAYPPQLLLVDGGKGQLTSAINVLKELDLFDEIPVASLAKQFEEVRSEEHTSELQSLMRSSYAVFCLKKKKKQQIEVQ